MRVPLGRPCKKGEHKKKNENLKKDIAPWNDSPKKSGNSIFLHNFSRNLYHRDIFFQNVEIVHVHLSSCFQNIERRCDRSSRHP